MRDYVAFALDLIESGYPYYIIHYGDGTRDMREWEAEAVQRIVNTLASGILVEIRPIDRKRYPAR